MMMIRIGSFRGSSRRWLQRDHVKGILKRICTRMVTTTTSGNECPEYIHHFVWRTMNPILTRTTSSSSSSSSTSRTVDVMMVIGWIPWYGGSDGRCILPWQSGGVLFRDGFRMQHAH